jgi:hypothetical protein
MSNPVEVFEKTGLPSAVLSWFLALFRTIGRERGEEKERKGSSRGNKKRKASRRRDNLQRKGRKGGEKVEITVQVYNCA